MSSEGAPTPAGTLVFLYVKFSAHKSTVKLKQREHGSGTFMAEMGGIFIALIVYLV